MVDFQNINNFRIEYYINNNYTKKLNQHRLAPEICPVIYP